MFAPLSNMQLWLSVIGRSIYWEFDHATAKSLASGNYLFMISVCKMQELQVVDNPVSIEKKKGAVLPQLTGLAQYQILFPHLFLQQF